MKQARRSVGRMVVWSCVAISSLACSSAVETDGTEHSSAVRQPVSNAQKVPGGLLTGSPTAGSPTAGSLSVGASAVGSPSVGSPTAGSRSAGVRPGELIVKYKSDGPQALTECAERWIREGRSFSGATADGSASLDGAQRQLGVRGARAIMAGRRGLTTHDAKLRLMAANKSAARRAGRPAAAATGRSVADLVNLYVLELPQQVDVEAAARTLAADPHVDYAQPNYLVKADMVPNDPYFFSSGSWGQAVDDLWGIKKISAPLAWDTVQGDGVLVAVIDTGLDATHPDIAANVWRNPDEIPGNGIDDDHNGFVDDVDGWDFASNDADPTDEDGHGTHVAGTIAAVGNNALGVIGVAPRAKIQAVRLLGPGGGDTATAVAAITYAVQNNASVINASWGCTAPCPSNPVIEDTVRVAHDAGVTLVFSAGNINLDVGQFSPQNQPDVIVVSASDPDDQRLNFSNHGFVDVAAPGGGPYTPPPDFAPHFNILSLKASINVYPPEIYVGDDYLRLAGTSQAAPHVTGAAALLLAAHPSYSPEQVRQALRRGSVDTGAVGVDLDSGYGRLDAAAAVAQPVPLEALITGPLNVLSRASVAVTGSAAGTGFANYVVEVGDGDTPSSFTPFAVSTRAVSDGTLATWDYRNVAEGVHTLRLRAVTGDGRTYEDRQRVTLDRVLISDPPWDEADIFGIVSVFGRTTISVRGTAAPPGFSRYDLTVVRSSDGAPLSGARITVANGGRIPVTDGVLGTWDTSGVPADGYDIVLTVQVSTGAPITAFSRVAVDTTLHPGWPVDYSPIPSWDRFLMPTDYLTAADVNRDGKAEVCVGYGSEVMIFDHTGQQISGWPQTIDPLGRGDQIEKSPVVADVTGDGIPEVIAANTARTIFVWRNNGQLLYQAQLEDTPCPALASGPVPYASYCTPSLAVDDVNGDGANDVIATDTSGNLTVLRVQDNRLVQWYRQSLGNRELSAPSVGDLDGDGRLEIAVTATEPWIDVPNRTTQLYVFGRNGVLSGWPQNVGDQVNALRFAEPVMGDVNRDGRLDVVMTSQTGDVIAFAANGTALTGWPRNVSPAWLNSPTLGDVDGDGRLDIVAGTGNYSIDGVNQQHLFALRDNGETLPGWPGSVTGELHMFYFGFGAAALADIDGDGGVEAIAAADSPTIPAAHALRAYHSDGSLVAGYPKPTAWVYASESSSAAVADVDGDGLLEMAWADHANKVYLYDLTAKASAVRPWPMFQHDAQHTGRADPVLRATFESRDSDPTNNLIQPKLRVVNGGATSVPLGQITLRYWYTNETSPSAQIFQLYIAQNEATWTNIPANRVTSRFVRVSPARAGADTYLEIGFTSTAGTVFPASAVGLEFNVHAQNWARYNERDDYSYSSSSTRIDWNRVTIYRNGVLVWGREP